MMTHSRVSQQSFIFQGHCTDKKQPTAIVAVVGAIGKSKVGGVTHEIIQIAMHPGFHVSF